MVKIRLGDEKIMEVLQANVRQKKKKSASNALRNEGKIPAVVYGKNIGSEAIHIEEKDFLQVMRAHGSNAVINLEWEQASSSVMISDIQQDPIKKDILHIDFKEVDMKEKIKVEVPVNWVGEEDNDGIVQKQLHTIEVQCLPNKIPDQFTVDVSHLEIGQSITAAELEIPADVELLVEPDTVLASSLAPTLESDPLEPQIDDEQEPEMVDATDESNTNEE